MSLLARFLNLPQSCWLCTFLFFMLLINGKKCGEMVNLGEFPIIRISELPFVKSESDPHVGRCCRSVHIVPRGPFFICLMIFYYHRIDNYCDEHSCKNIKYLTMNLHRLAYACTPKNQLSFQSNNLCLSGQKVQKAFYHLLQPIMFCKSSRSREQPQWSYVGKMWCVRQGFREILHSWILYFRVSYDVMWGSRVCAKG